MKENLLHFIWKMQLFSKLKLSTTANENIQIISPGLENTNSGPDFFNAKIEVGNQLWSGNVEIHVLASDWYLHSHQTDENYNNVILHVVWENDVPVFRKTNEVIPTLELKKIISPKLLSNYNQLFKTPKKWINCENDIAKISEFTISHWLERLYFERLEQKAQVINDYLIKTNNNWEATLFVFLAKNFGLKVNGEAFFNMANSFSFSVVRKVAFNKNSLESLFFGQSNLLSSKGESRYLEELQREYLFLQNKFKLKPLLSQQVQFFRLRPANFPTIRLSQLATLYRLYTGLFSKIIEVNSLEEYYKVLTVSTSEFWETHYSFDADSKKRNKILTKSFIDLLLINTILPIKFLYFKSLGKSDYTDLINVMTAIKPEKNTIISKFESHKLKVNSAFDSQALIQLKNEYCNKQLCLRCEIGKDLLKN